LFIRKKLVSLFIDNHYKECWQNIW